MPSDQSEQIEDLFQQAAGLPEAERGPFLDGACGGNAAVRATVEKLLAADKEAESNSSWEDPAIFHEARSAARRPAAELDRYRLLNKIGSGGMGTVYKAVRADDTFSKMVAVKIVHLLDHREDMLRRFTQERQILAGLEHPAIVRLLDGGATGDGSPFLVMEYVDGVSLTQYIEATKPTLRESLELFRKICGAVAYAHRNLIVHRDLKPANILVTSAGEPKLLDFGIATLLDGSLPRTSTGLGAMTPQYASPEQINGAPITTASDIYSLGVLLYELLSGARPYGAKSNALELAQAITTQNPEPLRTRSGRAFDADLENIVQMAMRREPERRYATVDQFSDDIHRYLNGYPVASRPDTHGYRIRKFLARNKLGVAAGVLIAATLAGGVYSTVRQARIANQRFNDVRQLAHYFLFDLHDAIKTLPGATAARQMMLTRGLQYLDGLSKEQAGDRGLRLELAQSYSRVADLQGGIGGTTANLGDKRGAMASYQKAVNLLEPLAADFPHDTEIAEELAGTYNMLGDLQGQFEGDLEGAARTLRKGVALLEKLAAASPGDVRLQSTLSDSYILLADVSGNGSYQNLGDAPAAATLYRKSIAINEKLKLAAQADPERVVSAALPHARLGMVLQTMADKEGAVAEFRRVLELDEEALARAPNNTSYRDNVAGANRNLGLSLAFMNRQSEGRPFAERAARDYEDLARIDPKNGAARNNLAGGYYALAYTIGNSPDAMLYYDRAIAIYEAMGAEHPVAVPPIGLRNTYQYRADTANGLGDTKTAISSAQELLRLDSQVLKLSPKNAAAQREQAMAQFQLGRSHEILAIRAPVRAPLRAQELSEAQSWLRKSADQYQAMQRDGTLTQRYAENLKATAGALSRVEQEMSAPPR
ncbi:MAG TPA: protein kinase [Bryobacteraceae bacterium]|jgi:tetratricopeptide (TPR) repeat protein/predicted Ser/Thr protein kinase